jgi:hypothetical protein
MKRLCASFFLCLLACGLRAEGALAPKKPKMVVDTNLAYMALGALSTSADNLFLILPLELRLPTAAGFGLVPSLTFLYFGKGSGLSGGAMLLGECGVSWYPEAWGSSGWCFELSPGIAYAFDSRHAGLVVSGAVGYQWLLVKGLFLGLAAGARYVYMEGSLFLPDLKLRLGFAL